MTIKIEHHIKIKSPIYQKTIGDYLNMFKITRKYNRYLKS